MSLGERALVSKPVRVLLGGQYFARRLASEEVSKLEESHATAPVMGRPVGMNTGRNLPILLRYEADGAVSASCPFLPECHCKCATRTMALQMMQRLIKHALLENPSLGQRNKYEVVHLPVTAAEDIVDNFRKGSRRPTPERARIEII